MEVVTREAARREAILEHGIPLAELAEYQMLTLNLAEAVPILLEKIQRHDRALSHTITPG